MALADDIQAMGQDLADLIEGIASQALADVIAGVDPHVREVPGLPEIASPELAAVWDQLGLVVALGVRNGVIEGGALLRAEADAAKAAPPSVTSGSATTLGAIVGGALGFRLGKAMRR